MWYDRKALINYLLSLNYIHSHHNTYYNPNTNNFITIHYNYKTGEYIPQPH